jgi:hypothetical protein
MYMQGVSLDRMTNIYFLVVFFGQIALNEQFMVGSLSQTPALQGAGAPHGKHKRQGSGSGESNLVMRILRSKQGATKTFGENVIFILNRAGELLDS